MTQAEKDLYERKYIVKLETLADVLQNELKGIMPYFKILAGPGSINIQKLPNGFKIIWSEDDSISSILAEIDENNLVTLTNTGVEIGDEDDETVSGQGTRTIQLPYVYDYKQGKQLV